MQDMLNFIEYLLAFVVVLSIVVFVHEMGHFLVARMCGVRVLEFSIGFGKKLFCRKDKKGTDWCIRAIPLGGFVQMLGDADASSAKADESINDLTEEEKKVAFPFQPVRKKLAIIFAGPAINYVFAILLMTGVYAVYGDIKIPSVVGSVKEDSVAAAAGIMAGDKILSVDGNETKYFSDIKRWVVLAPSNEIVLKIDRDGKEMDVGVTFDTEPSKRVLGIMSKPLADSNLEKLSLSDSFIKSVELAYKMTEDTLIYLGQVFTFSRSPDEMRGPLGIAEASGDAAKGGMLSFLFFLVQISIGIGFINFLPIPLLDGGQLVVYSIEGVTGKAISPKIQEKALMVGAILLMGLLILTLWNDIPRIFNRLLG